MKLFILISSLFFGAGAFAAQAQPPFTPRTQAILTNGVAHATQANIDHLRYNSLTAYPSRSNEYEKLLFFIVEAERAARYTAEKTAPQMNAQNAARPAVAVPPFPVVARALFTPVNPD